MRALTLALLLGLLLPPVWVSAQPSSAQTPLERARRANELARSGQHAEAIAELEALLDEELSPQTEAQVRQMLDELRALQRFEKARTLGLERETAKAIAELDALLESEPPDHIAEAARDMLRGQLQMRLDEALRAGESDLVRSLAQRIEREFPDTDAARHAADALVGLELEAAQEAFGDQRFDEAAEGWERAAQSARGELAASALFNAMLARESAEQWDDVIRLATQLLREHEDSRHTADAAATIARVAKRSYDFEAIAESTLLAFDVHERTQPDEEPPRELLFDAAWALELMGRPHRAARTLQHYVVLSERAGEHGAELAEIRRHIVALYLQAGRDEAALRAALRVVLDTDETVERARALLLSARILERTGQTGSARKRYAAVERLAASSSEPALTPVLAEARFWRASLELGPWLESMPDLAGLDATEQLEVLRGVIDAAVEHHEALATVLDVPAENARWKIRAVQRQGVVLARIAVIAHAVDCPDNLQGPAECDAWREVLTGFARQFEDGASKRLLLGAEFGARSVDPLVERAIVSLRAHAPDRWPLLDALRLPHDVPELPPPPMRVPDDDAHSALAAALRAYREGDHADAIEQLEALVEGADDGIADVARYDLALLLHRLGRHDDAAAHIEVLSDTVLPADDSSTDDIAADLERDVLLLAVHVEHARGNEPTKTIPELAGDDLQGPADAAAVVALILQNDLEAALPRARRGVLNASPSDPGPAVHLAYIHLRRGEPRAALYVLAGRDSTWRIDFLRSVALEMRARRSPDVVSGPGFHDPLFRAGHRAPYEPALLARRALVFLRESADAEALDDIEAASRLRLLAPSEQRLLAIARVRNQDGEGAERALRDVVARHPGRGRAWLALGALYMALEHVALPHTEPRRLTLARDALVAAEGALTNSQDVRAAASALEHVETLLAQIDCGAPAGGDAHLGFFAASTAGGSASRTTDDHVTRSGEAAALQLDDTLSDVTPALDDPTPADLEPKLPKPRGATSPTNIVIETTDIAADESVASLIVDLPRRCRRRAPDPSSTRRLPADAAAVCDAAGRDDDVATACRDAFAYLRRPPHEGGVPEHARGPLTRMVLDTREEPEHVAQVLNDLALQKHRAGEPETAEAWLRAALKALGSPQGEPAVRLSLTVRANLASNLDDQGRTREAERLMIELDAAARGADQPFFAAVTRHNLGNLYQRRGDAQGARELLEPACDELAALAGEQHPMRAMCLASLALAEHDGGDVDGAIARFEQSLDLLREGGHAKSAHAATVLNNLGEVLRAEERIEEAERRYAQALTIRSARLRADHPDLARTLNNLGATRLLQGDHGTAEQLLRRALIVLRERFGPKHLDVAETLGHLAAATREQGRLGEALQLRREANAIEDENLVILMHAGSQRQRLAFAEALNESIVDTISLHLDAMPQSPDAARLALDTVLARKGRVVELEARMRTTDASKEADSETARLRARLETLTSKLAAATLRGRVVQLESVSEMRAEIEAIERKLSVGRIVRPVAEIDSHDVQRALPADGALIEWTLDDTHYVAYVLRPTGPPVGVRVGRIEDVESSVAALLDCLRRGSGCALDEARARARAAASEIYDPLADALGDQRHLFFSPDGVLHLLPWGALVLEDGGYLLQQNTVSILGSGRDMVALTEERGDVRTTAPPMVLADPDYTRATSGTPPRTVAQARAEIPTLDATENTERGTWAESLRGVELADDALGGPWPQLPGARSEGLEVAALLGGETQVAIGGAATESMLRSLRSPRILHIATHGFFLDDSPATPARSGARSTVLSTSAPHSADEPGGATGAQSALERAGLVLAGANGLRGDDQHDGILTATEAAASLDLRDTELVVLSACETGIGHVANGEGVYGLRRGLAISGARSQLMSLWQVDDVGTRELMVRFYRRLLEGEGRHEALRHAQLSMLTDERFAHPWIWSAFVASGDWRTLAGEEPDAVKTFADEEAIETELVPGGRGCGCRTIEDGDGSSFPTAFVFVVLGLAMARRRNPRGATLQGPIDPDTPVS